jgi:hypothetical protein
MRLKAREDVSVVSVEQSRWIFKVTNVDANRKVA